MGQYYHPVNLDKKQYLYSHEFDNGLKLTEHSWLTNNFVEAVEKLLAFNGPWHKTRLVWAGDYMDEGLFITDEMKVLMLEEDNKQKLLNDYRSDNIDDIVQNMTLHSFADSFYEKLSPAFIDEVKTEVGNYIVNHTKKEFVDKGKCPVSDVYSGVEYRVHPLPLLTCSGNGRGGGDYRGDDKYIGVWAGDIISVEQKCPTKYTEIIPDFKE